MKVRIQALVVAGLVAAAAVSRADTIPVDPSITYYINVPKAPLKFKPGGWGFLVVTFDREITGGTFIFLPECKNPGDGTLDEDNKKTIQFGPGSYGLGQTDTPDGTKGDYKKLEITINYPDPANPPPKIIFGPDGAPVSFWQFKQGGFDFNTETQPGDRKDQALAPSEVVPTPSAVVGGLVCGTLVLGGRMRRMMTR